MANENEYANTNRRSEAYSAVMSPAFVTGGVGLGLIHVEPFDPGVKVKKFQKSGYTTAMTVTEGNNFTYGSTTELTDTNVSATAEKKVAATKHTVESLDFATVASSLDRFGAEHGKALGRLVDYDLLALFAAVTNMSTATTTLTEAEILAARYYIRSATKGAFSGKLVGILDYKGAYELDAVLIGKTGGAFFQQVPLGFLGVAETNKAHYRGNLFGCDFYETDGLSTHSSQDQGCMWDPEIAFAMAADTSGFNAEIIFTGSQGLHYELTTWTYWKIVEWNDTAACVIESNT